MGKHAAAADAQHPTEVTLERVAEALRGLGFASVQRDDAPDRLVVAALSFTAAVWIDYRQPMALVVDTAERIPTDFEHATALARFINTWNHDRVGPAASYRLAESGDFTVRMRRPIHIKHGLTDEQLGAELVDTLAHAASFSTKLRTRFLDAALDHLLPPQLLRLQDAEVLNGRHPSLRHLPRGGREDIVSAPELFAPLDAASRPVAPETLAGVLDSLDFRYAMNESGIIATGVNGVPFALTVDGDSDETYARVTGMWDTGLDADEEFLRLWLVCNDVNERATGAAAYLHEFDGRLHMHAEATMLATAGAAAEQVEEFTVSSMAACLASIDYVSQLVSGRSAVEWPNT